MAKENGSSKGGNSGILRSILIILVVMLVFPWFQTDPKGYEVVMSQIGFERQMD